MALSPQIQMPRRSSAALPPSPPARQGRLIAAAQIAAAGLVGFGLIMVIAANWAVLGVNGQTALIGTVIGMSALTAALFPRLLAPALLVTHFAVGGLLAHLGITYQAGGDPWQLFALWAALSLPFALAARHDALWSAWVLVAITALPLWLYAVTGAAWGGGRSETLVVWSAAAAIAAVMSPWSGLEGWLGKTRWAFRLATVQFIILVTTRALMALWSKDGGSIFVIGALLLAGLIALLIITRPFDFPLFAAGAIAAVVLVISLLWRVFAPRNNDIGTMLLLGLLSTGVVVGAGRLMMATARQSIGAFSIKDWLGNTSASAAPGADADLPDGVSRWPAILLSAIGAIFAAIPFMVFYGLLFGRALESSGVAITVGLATVAAGVFIANSGRAYGFGQIFGLIAIFTGKAVFAFGMVRGANNADVMSMLRMLAMSLLIMNVVLAIFVRVNWMTGLFGFSAATALLYALMPDITSLLPGPKAVSVLTELITVRALIVTLVGGGALVAVERLYQTDLGDRLRPFLKGWLTACLVGAAALAGPTLLAGATLNLTPVAETWQGQIFAAITPARWVAVLLTVCALASTLLMRHPSLAQRTIGPTEIGIAIVALALAYVMPVLAIPLVVLAVMTQIDSRAGIVAALLTLLWCIGSFYYSLALPLMVKGVLLITLGLGLGVMATADGIRLPVSLRPVATASALSPLVIYALIAAGVAGTAASAATTIAKKEAIIRDGRMVYVRLAPVDPRSLMQGDFMALRFVLPQIPRAMQAEHRVTAYADVDGRGIATIKRVGDASSTPSGREVPIALTFKAQWTIATDAFFFREGTGKRYEAARYGIFKLAANGTAVLTGLADERLTEIK